MEKDLCRDCKALVINDEALGGSRAISEAGVEYLALGARDEPKPLFTKYQFADTLPEYPRLNESYREGCECCGFLRESIMRSQLEYPPDATRAILKISYLWKQQGPTIIGLERGQGLVALLLQINLMCNTSRKSLSRPTITFSIDSDIEACKSWLRIQSSPASGVLGPENIAWIRSHHTSTSEKDNDPALTPSTANFIPSRLIDLGSIEESISPRLVLSKDIKSLRDPTQVKYAALSYCWGSPAEAASQYKTTDELLPERLKSIDLGSTTAVIRESAKVCKALGIRYLWVDAVCILQGNIQDWEQQAPQMSLVYSNASVTICPLSSRSCNQGFLDRSDFSFDIPFQSQINTAVSGHYKLRYSGQGGDSATGIGNTELEDIKDSLWDTRAWTFQEYQSSKFMILLGKRKIHLVTSEGSVSEGGTELAHLGLPVVPFLDRCIEEGQEITEEVFFGHWMTMATQYGRRELTYIHDKFPALSGMASYFQNLLNDRYFAGLWEKDMFRQLYWSVPGESYPSLDELILSFGNRTEYIAPSWSWARQITYFEFSHRYMHMVGGYEDYRSECKKILPSLSLHGEGINPYGRIDEAILRITTRVLRIEHVITRVYDEAFTDRLWQLQEENGGYVADLALDWEDGLTLGHDLKLLCLGSCIEESDDGPFGRNQRYAWGLIINPIEAISDHGENCHYRVGTFYSKPKDGSGLAIFNKCTEQEVCLI